MADLERPVTEVESDASRFRLMDCLLDAATSLENEARWTGADGGLVSPMDTFLHHFLDDTQLFDDPMSSVGWSLYDAEEARMMKGIADACEAMLVAHGRDLLDGEHYHTPEWQGIVERCRNALAIMWARPGPTPVPGLEDWSTPLDAQPAQSDGRGHERQEG